MDIYLLKEKIQNQKDTIKELEADLKSKKHKEALEIMALSEKVRKYGELTISQTKEIETLEKKIEELERQLDAENSSEIIIEYYKDEIDN